VVEPDLHFEKVRGEGENTAGADAASKKADAQFVARRRPMNVPYVPEPASLETHAAGGVEVIVGEQENEVHGGIGGIGNLRNISVDEHSMGHYSADLTRALVILFLRGLPRLTVSPTVPKIMA
jgi:hypothetical protein